MTWERPADAYPSGTILPWTGSLSTLPDGWVVCDGNNGTLDLRGRFVKSVPSTSTTPGSTGGENSKQLASGQLASHSHGGSTTNDGSHTHGVPREDSTINQTTDSASYATHHDDNPGTTSTSTDGSHDHTVNVDNAGSGNSIDNQPAYHETTFIQKL